MDAEKLYKSMLDNIYEGIYFVDTDRSITFWNQGAENLTGFSADEVVGHFCYDNLLNHVNDQGDKLCFGGCPLHATIQDGERRDANVYLHHKDGHRVAVKVRTTPIMENDVTVGAVEMFIANGDTFFDHYSAEDLKTLAYQDQLTELPNRRFLDKHLEMEMTLGEKMDRSFGVFFIDIDHFKKVNDTYGHGVGDEVLKMTARSLEAGLRKSDILGRWGGEEFLCIISDATLDILSTIGEKLRMLIENSSVQRQEDEIKVTISIGAALFKTGDTIDEVIDRADACLYQSKQNGRNRVTVEM